MDHQDWTPVTVKRRTAPPKPTAGSQEATRLSRLESDDIKVKHRRLTTESRQALTAARLAEKKTQRDVEKELAFPANLIRDFEAGTAAPSNAQMSALHRRFAAAHLTLKIETRGW